MARCNRTTLTRHLLVFFAERFIRYDERDNLASCCAYRHHMTNEFISLSGVSKTYPGPDGGFLALDKIDLAIRKTEFVAVVGQSGSGKSTLLSLLSGIDRPTSGEIHLDGTAVHSLSESRMSVWRGMAVGIVFQFFQLLPTLSAVENVMLPMDFTGRWPTRDRQARALDLLDKLGVADQANKLPSKMSGGQQQRVAVARALANAPAVLLADEPTGNLDSRTAHDMLDVLARIQSEGQTVVMVTHDARAREFATRTIMLVDGRIQPEQAASL
jgi:putative ABC transport system ATP-binding protein